MISKHLKKIVDALVEAQGVETTLSRGIKMNNMNKHLLEGYKSEGNEAKADGVQKNINTNNTAIEYLKELLNNKNK